MHDIVSFLMLSRNLTQVLLNPVKIPDSTILFSTMIKLGVTLFVKWAAKYI